MESLLAHAGPAVWVALAFFGAFWVSSLLLAAVDHRRERLTDRLDRVRQTIGEPGQEAASMDAGASIAPDPWAAAQAAQHMGLGARVRAVLGGARSRQAAAFHAAQPADGNKQPESVRRLAKRLRRAGLPWRVEEFLAAQAICAALGGGLLVVIGHGWLWGIFGLIVGWLAPQFYLQAQQSRRTARCAADLPAVLNMMSNALKAGHSFLQAVEAVAKEMEGPLAEEWGQLVHEIRLNVSTEDALANLVDRVNSDDLDLLVTAVLIQRQVGGNLAQVLDQISTTIRDRIQMQGEVRALTSQGRLSGIVVGVLPIALLLLISAINPSYMAPLLSTTFGHVLLGLAMVMEVMGAVVIRRVVRIEI